MPKKTKKQKLLAQLRRQKQTQIISSADDPITKTEVTPSLFTFNLPKAPLSVQKTTMIVDESWIKKDLFKILFLSVLAFSFELAVYWVLHH